MKANRLLIVSALIALLGACVSERRTPPAPTPVPTARPPAPVAPPASPPAADWRDLPLTPGDWSYGAEPGGSSARFGAAGATPLLVVRCDRAAASVALLRSGTAAAAVPLTITTGEGTRPFSAAPQGFALAVGFAARDPFLDTLAFSRGRFAVEATGLAPLYLPAWPEIGRVVEDCR
ncbi:MAG: hypothetical protein ABW203_08655 [Novosphingobium sp.]